VAVLDVPPQVLLRNVTYGSSVGDGNSRDATGGLNSSEAWFIYLTFRYRDCGALLHFVLTAKFVKFVYIVYFFPAFSQRMYDMNFTGTKQSEQICPKPGKIEEETK
jgi:hypothetical protein